ncbi:MAG: FMN-binding protein [Candidatus Krumholzibacteriia bacterium]
MTDAKPPANPAAPGAESESAGSLRMILTMGGIGLVSGILIVLTFQWTLPVITRNKAVALERAIFEVVPGAKTKAAFKLVGNRLQPLVGEDELAVKYYACYDAEQRLVGVALEAQGQGFQDVLKVLYGYSPRKNGVVGLKVLESKETPGLGDKIETDPRFRANFEMLDVALDGDEVANPIEMVKHGKKTDPWQVEAITGATISSRAVAAILRGSTVKSVPIIENNLEILKKGNP